MSSEDAETKAARDARNAARGKKWQYLLAHLKSEQIDLKELATILAADLLPKFTTRPPYLYVAGILAAHAIDTIPEETLDKAVEYMQSKVPSSE